MTRASFVRNGPLKIEGELTLLDSHGKPFTLAPGKAVFLCRCGHSNGKPFCDGAHGRLGFQSDVNVPPAKAEPEAGKPADPGPVA